MTIPFGAPRIAIGSTAADHRANARHCQELYRNEGDSEHRRRLAECIAAYREAAERVEHEAAMRPEQDTASSDPPPVPVTAHPQVQAYRTLLLAQQRQCQEAETHIAAEIQACDKRKRAMLQTLNDHLNLAHKQSADAAAALQDLLRLEAVAAKIQSINDQINALCATKRAIYLDAHLSGPLCDSALTTGPINGSLMSLRLGYDVPQTSTAAVTAAT